MYMNYSVYNDKSQEIGTNTIVKIRTKSIDFCSDFNIILPLPQKHYIDNQGFFIYYFVIKGFFSTQSNYGYLNDILKRLLLTFEDIDIESVKQTKTSYEYYLELKQFQKLKSLAHDIATYKERSEEFIDERFWLLKLYAETLISKYGIFSLEDLMKYGAYHIKYEPKYKYKCKSIYDYYLNNGFTKSKYIKKDKDEVMATRKEQIEIARNALIEQTRKKVFMFTKGLYAEDYKKKNGKWNVSKISAESGVSRLTVAKYLKEI